MNDLAALLPLVAILALFWFMVVRPQQRRQKDVVRLQQSIEVGQRVMMSSGIYGTVVSLADDRARLEIAPGTADRHRPRRDRQGRRAAGAARSRRARRCLTVVRPRRRCSA